MSHLLSKNGQPLLADRGSYSSVVVCLLASGVLSLLAGCFDAEAMIASRRHSAQLAGLKDVDLGAFRVTLPQLPDSTIATVVDFHAFGRVAKSDFDTVAQTIAGHGAELRHRMLIAVRELDLDELEEPSLDALRAKIEQVFSDTVGGELLQAVGFYRFALSAY